MSIQPIGAHRVGHEQHGEYHAHERNGRHDGPNRKSQPGGNKLRVSTIDAALDHYGSVYVEHSDLDDGETGYIVTLGAGVPGCACSTLGRAIRSAVVANGNRECARGGGA